jgi:hypothetical protein
MGIARALTPKQHPIGSVTAARDNARVCPRVESGFPERGGMRGNADNPGKCVGAAGDRFRAYRLTIRISPWGGLCAHLHQSLGAGNLELPSLAHR